MASCSNAESAAPASPADIPVQTLKGVGPRNAGRLERLGILTLEDLLFHLPVRYQDRTRVTPIGGLSPGIDALIEAQIVLADVSYRGRRMLLCRLQDGTGSLTLRFFHFTAAQQAQLCPGTTLRCFGEVRQGSATLEMIHPEYRRLDDANPPPVEAHLTPFYPSTEGLHQLSLRGLTEQALDHLLGLPDYLPPALLARLQLPPLHAALGLLHRPPATLTPAELESGSHPARRRLAFEELLAHQISQRRLRQQLRQHRAPAIKFSGALSARFTSRLPFLPDTRPAARHL